MTGRQCPGCGAMLDAHANTTGNERPEAGDATVCAYCRCVLVFTDNGLRYPEKAELVEFMRDPAVKNAVDLVSSLHRRGAVS